MIELERHVKGPRLRLFGQRVHHGAVGCALLAGAGVRRHRGAALAAVVLVVHDRRDVRSWFVMGAQR